MKSFRSFMIHFTSICFVGAFLVNSSALGAGYSSGVTAHILKKTSVTADGNKIVYPKTDKAEVTAMTVEIAPGAETGWHKHPVPVYGYVISGNLSVELEGGQRFNYATGEAIIEVINTMHNGKNNGTEPVQLAVFYLGAEGLPNVIKRQTQGSIEQNKKD
jgi:quercetin dioxygenase-like cupin family protein